MIRPYSLRDLNAKLFLLALVIAIALKFAVHEREQVSERVLDAQVTYTTPGPDMVSYNLVDKVKIGVRGKASDISRLSVFNVEVVAAVPDTRGGPTTIQLQDKDVRFNADGDFEVLSIDPNRFSIQVERRVRNVVPVEVVLVDEPAAGSRAGTPRATPSQAQISGPESRVSRITVLTVQISLEGHARTFEEDVGLQALDPLVQVVQPNIVTVEVPMEEPELSIDLEGSDDEADAR